ncbi:hypothetical protein TNCV_4832591 [Trichonephila clavipes]|nr:hypothetical protein TNCV_4832591 [Trichonephila clavipes]
MGLRTVFTVQKPKKATPIVHQADSSATPDDCVIPCTSSITFQTAASTNQETPLQQDTTARRLRHPLPAHRRIH